MTQEGNAKARAMFEKAIELDPKYAYAYVAVGWTYFFDASNGWMEPSKAFSPREIIRTLYGLRSVPWSAHPKWCKKPSLWMTLYLVPIGFLSQVDVYKGRAL